MRQAGNAGDRVADLVSHTGGQAADAGQAFGVHEFVFEHLRIGKVFDQHHQATVAGCQGLGDGGLVQVEPAGLAVERQTLLVQVLVGQIDELQQQCAPGLGDGQQAGAHDPLRGDAGQFFHGLVPHQDLLILGQ